MGEQPAWIRIQKKTFTRWSNNYLQQRDLSIKDLATDLADGVLLHALLEVLGAEEIRPKVNRKARMKLQRIENLNTSLKYIKQKAIKLVGIGAEDIHDGNVKLILGLIWTLILRFQVMNDDDEGASARQALLDWCNSVLNPQGLSVANFTNSWQDGRAFCGLVNALEPDQIPLNEVPASQPIENMERAFDDAEELFSFPQVIDAEDVVENPDDLSIMTYVSYFRAYMAANTAFAANCWAEGPGLTEGTTNEDAPFTIFAANEEGERASRGGAMMRAYLRDGETEVTKVTIKDNRDGTYSCFYNSPTAGTFELWLGVSKKPIKNVPYHPVIKPGEPSPGMCEAYGPGIEGAVAGEEVGFTIVTKDVAGTPLVKGGANITAVLKDAAGDIPVAITDNSDGTYSAAYTAKSAGTSILSVVVATEANGTGEIKDAPFTITVTPGAADLNNFDWDGLELDADGNRVVVAGTTDSFSVTAKDGNGNQLTTGGLNVAGKISDGPAAVDVNTADGNDGSYTLTYTPVVIGQYQFAVDVDGTLIGGSEKNPFGLKVIPAGADGANSIAHGPGVSGGVVGEENPFQVDTYDAFGNKVSDGGADVAGQLVHQETGEVVPVTVKDNGDGTYSCNYSGVTKTGPYTLLPTVGGEPVKDAPFTINVGAGGFDPNNTDVEFPDKNVAGRKGPTIKVKDNNGNLRAGCGDKVEADLIPKLTIGPVSATDNGDGTFDLDYPANLHPGDYDVAVRVNGATAPNVPFGIEMETEEIGEEQQAAINNIGGDAAGVLSKALALVSESERQQIIDALSK